MSSKKGELVTCDRCGKTTFRLLKGNSFTDGGYSSYNEFEPMPDGWNDGIGVNGKARCTLCPSCWKAFLDTLERFYSLKVREYDQ